MVIFAEVVSEGKYRIVEVLQKSDHMVGKTGDEVNDAPALKLGLRVLHVGLCPELVYHQ